MPKVAQEGKLLKNQRLFNFSKNNYNFNHMKYAIVNADMLHCTSKL